MCGVFEKKGKCDLELLSSEKQCVLVFFEGLVSRVWDRVSGLLHCVSDPGVSM